MKYIVTVEFDTCEGFPSKGCKAEIWDDDEGNRSALLLRQCSRHEGWSGDQVWDEHKVVNIAKAVIE